MAYCSVQPATAAAFFERQPSPVQAKLREQKSSVPAAAPATAKPWQIKAKGSQHPDGGAATMELPAGVAQPWSLLGTQRSREFGSPTRSLPKLKLSPSPSSGAKVSGPSLLRCWTRD